MNFNNMIPVSNLNLLRLLISLQVEKQRLLLWQTSELGERRNLNIAKVFHIDSEHKEIVFSPEGSRFNFKDPLLIYAFGNEKNIIFKTKVKCYNPSKLTLEMPETTLIQNTRKEDRVSLLGQKIVIQFSTQLIGDVQSLQKSEIVDMSSSGLSFKASAFNDYGLQKGDSIWMKLDGDKELKKGEVRHLSTIKANTHESFVQIGVSF